jgi:hypothetical protein
MAYYRIQPMIRHRIPFVAILVLALIVVTDALAEPLWERVDGGPGTTCALGTPFFFWVHRGSPDRLAIYLRGGGACWNRSTCDPDLQPSYVWSIDGVDAPAHGLAQFTNPDNPVRDYTMVYVPYCTGDLHLGTRDVTYANDLTIRHRGRANVQAALAWVYRNIAAPESILVAGGSAGALPSPVYALEMARRYPDARVVQIGDGAGAFRRAATLTQWGGVDGLKHDPAFAAIDPASPSYLDLYEMVSQAMPRVQLTQINSTEDSVQRHYLELRGNSETRVATWLGRNMTQLRRLIPGFRSYSVPGTMHTVLFRPQFYATSFGNMPLYEWVARLLTGTRVPDIGEELLAN